MKKSGKRKSGKAETGQEKTESEKAETGRKRNFEIVMKTELEGRTMQFTVAVIECVRTFPKAFDGIEVGRQLLRSAGSIGANYREANRAESQADFAHKIGVAEKEASETNYWLEVCLAASLGGPQTIKSLLAESSELFAILTTIGRKAKGK